jgi:small subunit ribosomal protein S8
MNDLISDFLIRLKNAGRAKLEVCEAPFSRMLKELARILEEEGYIWNYEEVGEGVHKKLKVKMKYQEGTSAITDVKRVSRPGTRHYVGVDEIPRVLGGLGISILSTPKGVMTGHKARRTNTGGELLALVW